MNEKCYLMIIRIDKLVTNWAPRETKPVHIACEPPSGSQFLYRQPMSRRRWYGNCVYCLGVCSSWHWGQLGGRWHGRPSTSDAPLERKYGRCVFPFRSEKVTTDDRFELECPWFGVKSWKSDCFASSFSSRLVWLRYNFCYIWPWQNHTVEEAQSIRSHSGNFISVM